MAVEQVPWTATSTPLRDIDLPVVSRLPFADARTGRIIDFYWNEAELLDGNRLDEWLDECVDETVDYTMPVRVSLGRVDGSEFVGAMAHFDDDRAALAGRIAKLHTGMAWAEDPPSRTRRHVTNVRAHLAPPQIDDGSAPAYVVKSYLLVLRNRLDRPTFDLISAERLDLLTDRSGGLRLTRREILVDQSCLGTANLAIIL
jgi:3-phenylpropionate/cinnamic acid dioxygenase small subunit